MSPHAALHSRVFLGYAIITIAVLALAAAAIWVRGRGKDLSAVWATYRSWLVMVPVIGLCVYLGNWAVVVGMTALVLLGFREFATAAGIWAERWMTGATLLALAAAGGCALLPGRFPRVADGVAPFLAMPAVTTLLLLAIPVVRDRAQGQIRLISLCLFGFLQGWLVLHIVLLVNTANPYGFLLYIVFATELNDVAAFTFGRLFGRRPLRPVVSPKKTWEGALGAAGFSVALAFALWFSFPHLRAFQVLMIGLIVAVGGQLGDLSVSVIKRDLGVKDLGSAIPGHGGILDRIDSLTFVAPLYFYFLRAVSCL